MNPRERELSNDAPSRRLRWLGVKKSLVASASLLVFVAACSAAAPTASQRGEPTGSTSSAVQDGTNDATHKFAVGIVVNPDPTCTGQQCEVAFCSGSLLAPNLVATARHCSAQISSDQIDCATATFGADFAPSQFLEVTTNESVYDVGSNYAVAKVVTPSATGVCGDDLALLILATNVTLPEYVTPVITPPMTDRSAYASQVTAIGYGIDSPTDEAGVSAGTRRIRENIPINCIPNDSSIANCYPTYQGIIAASEFQTTGGTCEGDSGSGAFDQNAYNSGTWESFGVLSRGGVSSDGMTCQGAVYTRFDAYGDLLTSTAKEAAQMGGYALPVWAGGTATSSSSSSSSASASSNSTSGGATGSGSSGGATAGGAGSSGTGTGAGGNGAACKLNSDCASNNCVTANNGGSYVCADSCAKDSDCPSGFACEQTYCLASGGTTGSGGSSTSGDGSGGKKGCSVAAAGTSTEGVPWGGLVLGLAAGGVATRRRRRR